MARARGRALKKTYKGKVTWAAVYWHKGSEVSAGTYESKELADLAWQAKVGEVSRGLGYDPQKSQITFRTFVEDIYKKKRRAKRVNTATGIDGTLDNHLLPEFGHLRLVDLMEREAISNWRAEMDDDEVPTSTQRTRYSHLSLILSDARRWGYISVNPCFSLERFEAGENIGRALTHREGDSLLDAMLGPVSTLFVDLDLNSGMRWGEITELRVSDLSEFIGDDQWDENEEYDDRADDMLVLHVQRSVSDVSRGGERFVIEPTPKNKKSRKIPIDPDLSDRLIEHIKTHDLKNDDLLFPKRLFDAELQARDETALRVVIPPPSELGMTEPNAKGRVYAHGTSTAYALGPCRCVWCKKSQAEYRAQRRARGLDLKPRVEGRSRNTTGHMPRDTFRRVFWRPALDEARLGNLRFHDLRHTHATWLAKGAPGFMIDLVELMNRMGHLSIATTMRYINDRETLRTSGALLMMSIRDGKAKRQTRRAGGRRLGVA